MWTLEEWAWFWFITLSTKQQQQEMYKYLGAFACPRYTLNKEIDID